MNTTDLKQKLLNLADTLLTYSFMVRGENRQIVDALRVYVAADMSDDELEKVLRHLPSQESATPPSPDDVLSGAVNDVTFRPDTEGYITLTVRPDNRYAAESVGLLASEPESSVTIDGRKVDLPELVSWLLVTVADVKCHRVMQRYGASLVSEFFTAPNKSEK